MKNGTQGFTLIELLIVIAIIGILAAVLIPNLMGARQSAQEKAAQAHSSNVATAVNAWLAGSSDKKPTDAIAAGAYGTDCMAAKNATATDGTQYGYGAAPTGATACAIAADDATGTISATVTTPKGTYTNGVFKAKTSS